MMDIISVDDKCIIFFSSGFTRKKALTFHAISMKCQSLFSKQKEENYNAFVVCLICPESDKGYFFVKWRKCKKCGPRSA